MADRFALFLFLFGLITESGNLHAVTRYRRNTGSSYLVCPDRLTCQVIVFRAAWRFDWLKF